MGVSPDSGISHQKFIEKNNLPFTLLSDPDKKVMTAYGAFGEKKMYGKLVQGVIRSTVWIGPDGKVKKHWPKVAKAAADELRAKAGDSAKAWREATELYLIAQDWARALAAAERLLELTPKAEETERQRVEVLLARVYAGKGDDQSLFPCCVRSFE